MVTTGCDAVSFIARSGGHITSLAGLSHVTPNQPQERTGNKATLRISSSTLYSCPSNSGKECGL